MSEKSTMIEFLKSSKDLLAAENENLKLKLHNIQEKFNKGCYLFKIKLIYLKSLKINQIQHQIIKKP